MNCESCQERLSEYLLGELDAPTADAIDQHLLSGCEQCNRELKSVTDSIDLLVLNLEYAPSAADSEARRQVWQDIQSKLKSPVAEVSHPSVSSEAISSEVDHEYQVRDSSSIGRWIRGGLAASLAIACGFAVATFSMQLGDQKPIPNNDIGLAQPAKPQPSVQVIALRPKKKSSVKSGTLIYDVAVNQLHFYTAGLSNPQPGKHYSLWFVTVDDEWILGGKLIVKNGVAGQVFDLPKSGRPVQFAAVTLDSDTSPVGSHGSVALVSDDVRQPLTESVP